jgi:lipoate-protein ligase A
VSSSWVVHHRTGDAGAFHALEPVVERSITLHMVEQPTLVLGSSQPDTDVDHRVAAALGVAVVRRRSGGGAVLLMPDEYVWADVVIPAGDPLWLDDVGRAMLWVGEWWQRALATVGTASIVHRDGLVADEWSRRICWTSIGTGEVLAAGQPAELPSSKYVGISQRRTRTYARFQTQVHLCWRPELVAALTAAPRPRAIDLAERAAAVPGAGVGAERIVAAFLATAP